MKKPKVTEVQKEVGLALCRAAFAVWHHTGAEGLRASLKALGMINDLNGLSEFRDAEAFARWMGEGVEVDNNG